MQHGLCYMHVPQAYGVQILATSRSFVSCDVCRLRGDIVFESSVVLGSVLEGRVFGSLFMIICRLGVHTRMNISQLCADVCLLKAGR